MSKPLEKVEKKHGGKRSNSGRKPLLDKAVAERVHEVISQHGIEIDHKDLKKRVRLLRLLDALYEKGVKKKDVPAIKEYLDRMLGKSKEHVDLTSKGKQIDGINYIRPNGADTPADR